MDDLDVRIVPAYAAILERTLSRLSERLEALPNLWMCTPDELHAALRHIVDAVEQPCPGDRVPRSVPPARRALHHRLTELLRATALEVRGDCVGLDRDDPEALLALVRALEGYRAGLTPGDWHDPVARLSEPDALELVVEVAHDLRSPLNSILFLAEVLRSGQSGPVTPHQRAQLGLIYGATMGMISVVNDVMEIAVDPEKAIDEETAPFSIGRVFASVHEVVRPIAEEKGIELAFSPPDYDHCRGRPGALGRIILNLTINALKFTEEGEVCVLARRAGHSQVTFSVRDTGRGIAPDAIPYLFEPFQRSTGRDSHFFAQAGLGLSIARRLVRSMGSELALQTEPGRGTTFTFTVNLPTV